MIEVSKASGGYLMRVTPPHSRASWRNESPIALEALLDQAAQLSIHMTDFWDAVIEADPTLATGLDTS